MLSLNKNFDGELLTDGYITISFADFHILLHFWRYNPMRNNNDKYIKLVPPWITVNFTLHTFSFNFLSS